MSLRNSDWQDASDIDLRAITAQSAGVAACRRSCSGRTNWRSTRWDCPARRATSVSRCTSTCSSPASPILAGSGDRSHTSGFQRGDTAGGSGAVFEDLYRGVLSRSDTKRLARAVDI